MAEPKTVENAKTFIEMAAKHRGWKVSRDSSFVEVLAEGLAVNYNRYGYFLCPCRDTGGSREKDKDIICPCAYCVPDQLEYGHCYCGLFLTEAFHASGKDPLPIPERRPPEITH